MRHERNEVWVRTPFFVERDCRYRAFPDGQVSHRNPVISVVRRLRGNRNDRYIARPARKRKGC